MMNERMDLTQASYTYTKGSESNPGRKLHYYEEADPLHFFLLISSLIRGYSGGIWELRNLASLSELGQCAVSGSFWYQILSSPPPFLFGTCTLLESLV